MTDRLQKIMEYAGVPPNKFAAILGIQRSSISHMMSGRNNPSLTVVQKILKCYPDISADWLLFGEGSMLKNGASASTPAPSTPPLPQTEAKAEPDFAAPTPTIDNMQTADTKPNTETAAEAPRTKVNRSETMRPQYAQPTVTMEATTQKNIEYQTIGNPVNSSTNVQQQNATIQNMLANGLIVLDHNSKTFTIYSPSM